MSYSFTKKGSSDFHLVACEFADLYPPSASFREQHVRIAW